MIHKKLSVNPEHHYGTNTNFEKTHVLLQLGDDREQVRVRLTPEEVDQVIADLKKRKEELMARQAIGRPLCFKRRDAVGSSPTRATCVTFSR